MGLNQFSSIKGSRCYTIGIEQQVGKQLTERKVWGFMFGVFFNIG